MALSARASAVRNHPEGSGLGRLLELLVLARLRSL